MPKISTRSTDMPHSPIRKLASFATEAEAKGIKVYKLNIGQPDLHTPQVALDVLKNIQTPVLEYSPSQGFLSYRKKLVDYYKSYDVDLTPDDIIITTGGSEALLFAFITCLNPGDEIIITEPAYANYITFAIAAGVKVKTISTSIRDGFALPSIDQFEALITERTRAILICNPNNPTGAFYSREELNQLRDVVKKHDLYLFSDEVYREYIYSDTPYTSAATLEGIEPNVVIIDSVSKRYSECGIRIGAFISKNKEIMAAALKIAQARLSPPLLGQIVAEASLETPPAYMKEMFDEYAHRREVLVEGLNKIPGVYCPKPKGAFYTMVELPVEDADDFCLWCLKEFNYEGETVMMAPASGFYVTPGAGRNQVRIAYVLKSEDLERAIEVLGHALKAYQQKS